MYLRFEILHWIFFWLIVTRVVCWPPFILCGQEKIDFQGGQLNLLKSLPHYLALTLTVAKAVNSYFILVPLDQPV